MTDLVQILVSGLTVGSVIALVAFGYNLVFASTRIVNFAQGSMLVVAGYVAFAITREGVPLWAAFFITILVSLGVGVLVEIVAIKPLGRFDPSTNVGWILTTFGVGLIAVDLIKKTIGADARRLPPVADSIFGWKVAKISGVAITVPDVLLVVSALLIVVGLEMLQRRTTLGRAFRAVAEDRQTAGLMGINTELMVMITFALAGALAAIGAVLIAPRLFVKLDLGVNLGLQAFIAAVIGGLGSTRGAIVGGYVIGFTTAIVSTITSEGGSWGPVVVFVVFLLVLVVRPQGIFGSPAVEKV
jgi:branched-chain amino acid transport system permease protein